MVRSSRRTREVPPSPHERAYGEVTTLTKKTYGEGPARIKKTRGRGEMVSLILRGGQIKSLLEENFTPLYPNLACQINIPKLLNLLLGHQLYITSIVLLEW